MPGKCIEHHLDAEVWYVHMLMHNKRPKHMPNPYTLAAGVDEDGAEFRRYLEPILPHATPISVFSEIHGPEHWERVFRNGLRLCDSTPGADHHVVKLFAVLHDTCRHDDGRDPDHGRRAAALAKELRGVAFDCTDVQWEYLVFALEYHADGYTAAPEEPSVGVCWDSDRLELPRCGIKPDPDYFSTTAGKAELKGF